MQHVPTTTEAAGSPLRFFADVVRTGTVAGVDSTFTPDEVRAAMGVEPGENHTRLGMWHVYGLVEFFWDRAATNLPWIGTHFSVQVHRLDHGVGYEIAQIVAAYGEAPDRVPYNALRDELASHDVPLIEIPWNDADLRAFWQPDSTALVLVVADDPSLVSHASTVAPGDVSKITVPHHPDRFEPATLTSTAGADQARHLASLNPDARRSWLDRQPPSTVTDASWWLHLFLHIDARTREQPHRRSDWVTLRLWLLDQAAVAGVFNLRDYAERRARFVGELFVRGLTAGLEDVLPSADELVHACLTAIPVSVAEVRSVADWRTESLDVMRRLRQTKNLVNAAQSHLHRIDDATITAELERWISLKPRLT